LYSFIDFGAPSGDYDSRYEVDMGIGTIFTVNSQFDLEAKYLTNYRKTPLVDGKEKTDSTFITNLVYKM
jgi:putative salt-induced outer membrane protein YdiY